MRKKAKKTAEKAPQALRILWEEGFFRTWKDQAKVDAHLAERGNNFPSNTLWMALARAPYLIRRKQNGILEHVQRKPAVSREVDEIETKLFDDALIKRFGIDFKSEIADLHLNFGKSGNCTAFLLRKILEKLIYITFSKNNLLSIIENKDVPGKITGLEGMINAATQQKKANGTPFLTANTAKAIQGIKFLGDISAHSPLTEVDIKTILPQMPFIITAYKELLS